MRNKENFVTKLRDGSVRKSIRQIKLLAKLTKGHRDSMQINKIRN